MKAILDRLFVLLQHLLPQHWLSRLGGAAARLTQPAWLVKGIIRLFIRRYRVDMAEAEYPHAEAYPNFNAFFTRRLVEGARPLASSALISPADGGISQLGRVEAGRILQAKGQHFTARELLGSDEQQADIYRDGQFITIYLSPRDYHRVHMPVSGKLQSTTYIPGRLFSVNGVTAQQVPRLFARNERLVCHFETEEGPMAMVLVGAMIVAGIETVWSGQEAPPPRRITHRHYNRAPGPVELTQGAEMGHFMLGSTVILLLPNRDLPFDPSLAAGSTVRMGQSLVG